MDEKKLLVAPYLMPFEYEIIDKKKNKNADKASIIMLNE